ncbi:MAG: hypothetical protein GXO32_03745 [Crenarchaeota archaeon]|nr:hypothetical protein [Thermoproteota archaeon]
MRAQGSVVVVAMVLMIALSILLALYTVMMGKIISTFATIESLNVRNQLSSKERLNVSIYDYRYYVYDHATYIDVYIEVTNVGTVSTQVSRAIAVCMNVWGHVKTVVIAQTVSPLTLQPGASGIARVYGTIPARCYSVTVVLVTMYGNSYEVSVP